MTRRRKKLKGEIITAFPHIFDSYLYESVLGRAIKKGLIEVKMYDLRQFGEGKRKTIDEPPFGGGPGMVLKFEPIERVLRSIKKKRSRRVILLSTRGRVFNEREARRLSEYGQLIFIAGRYEGVDERVAKYLADEEISVGDFILMGGELPALVIIEAVARLMSGVLGREESLEGEHGSYPVFTKPAEVKYRGKILKVPPVLLSGDHKKIKEWRGN